MVLSKQLICSINRLISIPLGKKPQQINLQSIKSVFQSQAEANRQHLATGFVFFYALLKTPLQIISCFKERPCTFSLSHEGE